MKVPLVYATNDAAVRLKTDDEVRIIEALPVVSELAQLAASRSKEAGFQASLRCSAHCGKKQESPVHITGHYAMRAYSCWCKACSRVRERAGIVLFRAARISTCRAACAQS